MLIDHVINRIFAKKFDFHCSMRKNIFWAKNLGKAVIYSVLAPHAVNPISMSSYALMMKEILSFQEFIYFFIAYILTYLLTR